MQTLVVLSIGLSTALGCLALGYGIFMTSSEAVKPPESPPVRDR